MLDITFGRIVFRQVNLLRIKPNRVQRLTMARLFSHHEGVRSMRPLRRLGPRLRHTRNAKAMRVAAISVDQLVPCPKCGESMRLLFDTLTFMCKRCDRAVDMERILKSLDAGE